MTRREKTERDLRELEKFEREMEASRKRRMVAEDPECITELIKKIRFDFRHSYN